MTKDVEHSNPTFLSRWSKRKADVRAEEVKAINIQNENANTGAPFEAKIPDNGLSERSLPSDTNDKPAKNPPLPAIESLTQESDFSPFMGKDVAADLRNQAMKKLFTDPHYNVQDGLDIYIGDYTKSDPIPLEMLRKMTQSKALFLFEEEEKAEAEAAAALAASEAAPIIDAEIIPESKIASDPDVPSTDVTDASIKSK
jgi:hypothetical protein